MSAPAIVDGLLSQQASAALSPQVRGRSVTTKAHLRRRPDPRQGRSLEALGHAIEYLTDAQMLTTEPKSWQNDVDAIQLLSRLSRDVFHECPIVVPVTQRLKEWCARRCSQLRSLLAVAESL